MIWTINSDLVGGWAEGRPNDTIDAVYRWDEDGLAYLVVDWKTSSHRADPLQLAVYRQAWAEAHAVDPAKVGAAFYHVLADQLRLVEAPASLIDEALEAGVEA